MGAAPQPSEATGRFRHPSIVRIIQKRQGYKALRGQDARADCLTAIALLRDRQNDHPKCRRPHPRETATLVGPLGAQSACFTPRMGGQADRQADEWTGHTSIESPEARPRHR